MFLLLYILGLTVDTINTASRMESTGAPNMIQVSEETATILKNEGFESWLRPREDLVYAKGKGFLQTYWLEINKDNSSFDNQLDDRKLSFVHKLYSGSLGMDDEIENDNSNRICTKNHNRSDFEQGNGDSILINTESQAAMSRCGSSSSSVFVDPSER